MGWTRRRLATGWVAAVLLVSLLAAPSALASSGHVTLTASGPSRVAPHGLAVVTGRARPGSGVRVELQERRGGWHRVESGRTGSGGTFVLPVRAKSGQATLTLRVLALKKGHRVRSNLVHPWSLGHTAALASQTRHPVQPNVLPLTAAAAPARPALSMRVAGCWLPTPS